MYVSNESKKLEFTYTIFDCQDQYEITLATCATYCWPVVLSALCLPQLGSSVRYIGNV